MACPLSIIVPCYKVEEYLPACLDSLVSQSLEGIEVICINDGSPDGCLSILRSYEERYPGTVVVIDKPNEGVWRARQDGIARAQGEYIGFVDSDDYVEPDFAEKLYGAAKVSDADIAVCGFSRIERSTGHVYSREMCDQRKGFSVREDPGRLIELNGAPWNKVFRAPLLKNMRDLSSPPPVLDDLVFHLLVYPHVDRIVFIPKSLVNYMVRADSIITTIRPQLVDAVYRAMVDVKDYYGEVGASPQLQEALDTIAFLHTGISLMHRLAQGGQTDMRVALANNEQFLDNRFAGWRNSSYVSPAYARSHGAPYVRLGMAHFAYTHGLMLAFFKAYSFMIETLGIDIKW